MKIRKISYKIKKIYNMYMKIINEALNLNTKGDGDLIDLTEEIEKILNFSMIKNGIMTVFVVGSTAAITSFEYEGGLIADIREFCEKILPKTKNYRHDDTWGDANGFSHMRATLFGPSLVIPFENGKLCLGTWQQVVLAEFDNRGRQRTVIVQMMGE